jgi:hypothetical protein
VNKPDWKYLDVQIQHYSSFLRDELKLDAAQSNRFATTISQDLESLSADAKAALKNSSIIPAKDRLDELVAFQGWMDTSLQVKHPSVARARVITQNYICFVYLGESCFSILKKNLPSGSVTRKACQFLTDNPIRAFRNAIAHANWKYKADYSGIEFWARKGSDVTEPMVKWEVNQTTLSFWQALSRTVAYVTFTGLLET